MRMTQHMKIAGFSLVELSVVLAVIGITLSGALTLATQKTESDKENETETKLDKIETALQSFVITNQRLPCPADGSLRTDQANFGVEGTPSTAGCAGSNFNDGTNTYAGVVPVKTLGLPDDVLFDGWDRRITYAVDFRLANSVATNATCDGTASTVCFQYTTEGSLIVRSDVDPDGSETSTEAVYTLISHGKNGYGAFLHYGNATRNDASTDNSEQENAETNTAGDHMAYDATFVQKSATDTFDDIVRYQTKWQLVDNADGVTTDEDCEAADTVVNAIGDNDICDNATSADTCEELATQVHQLCLQ